MNAMRIIPGFDHLPFSRCTSTQGLCYHRLQGLHNLKITHKKQDNIFIRQGTTGRAGLQMTVLVTKIWVQFNYLRIVHVAAICISKLLKYQHLQSPFQRLLSPTSEAHIFHFTHIAAQIQGRGTLIFCLFLRSELCPLDKNQEKCSSKLIGILDTEGGISALLTWQYLGRRVQTQQPVVSAYHAIIHKTLYLNHTLSLHSCCANWCVH